QGRYLARPGQNAAFPFRFFASAAAGKMSAQIQGVGIRSDRKSRATFSEHALSRNSCIPACEEHRQFFKKVLICGHKSQFLTHGINSRRKVRPFVAWPPYPPFRTPPKYSQVHARFG